MIAPERVISFWFAGTDPQTAPSAAVFKLWFQSTPEQDAEIRETFGEAMAAAIAGELDAWAAAPLGRLALVLLLDQLPRNAGRGTPDAFAGDPAARRHALAAIDGGEDQQLPLLYRIFLYLPLEHSEELALQDRCVSLFERAAAEAPPALAALTAQWLTYAQDHRDVIARFGRFPHRNAVLGREPTSEELAYLAGGGASYGQGTKAG